MNINIRTIFNVRSSVRKIFEKIRRRFSAIKRRYCESFKNEKNIFRDVTAPLLDVCVYLIFIARFFPAQECSRMCELGRSICFFVSRFKRSCFFSLACRWNRPASRFARWKQWERKTENIICNCWPFIDGNCTVREFYFLSRENLCGFIGILEK